MSPPPLYCVNVQPPATDETMSVETSLSDTDQRYLHTLIYKQVPQTKLRLQPLSDTDQGHLPK